ncbi:MAG TPA: PEP-CTERM sorting domain-containing protein [Aquabacterium sp.]|nr:PEP-CTERM sorting domain-containing protein [Aquabacterium sp.]
MSKFKLHALAALSAVAMSPVFAGQVITTAGGVSLGIQDLGALGYSGVGISLAGVGDAIMPGCLCEGWGASLGGVAGWSANANGGDNNVSLVSFSSTVNSAVSVANVGTGLQVTQSYGLSSSTALIKNHVTLTNTSGSDAAVRYSRSMDWDIPPTEFSEYVTIGGVGATNLIFSNDNGFATPNPLVNPGALVGGTTNVNVVDSGPADHGAFFTFDFGTLAAGKSVSFDIFYGAAGSEADAMAALGTVGAEVYSLGQNNRTAKTDGTPGTFIFGFAGVGGTPVPAVPEPETYAMVLAGLGIVGLMARRRRA